MRDIHKIIIFSIIILLLSQAFMIVLVSSSFEKTHLESVLTSYAVPQKDFNRKIEAGLRFGKELEHLLGMDTLINEYADHYDDLKNIEIYSADHNLLYSLQASSPDYVFHIESEGKSIHVPDPLIEVVETPDAYLIILPLFGPRETFMGTTTSSALAGSSVFSFHKHEIRSGVRQFWEQRIILGAGIAIIAAFLLFILLFRIRQGDLSVMRRHIFIRVLGVIILAQIVFAGMNSYQFHQDHVQGVKDKVHAQLDLLRSEMERVLARGIGLDRISRVDEFLQEVMDVNPEVLSMSIRDTEGRVRAMAVKEGREKTALEKDISDELRVSVPLRQGDKQVFIAEIRADLDKKNLRAMIWKLLLDSLTVTLIASLFIVEQIYFLISRLKGSQKVLPASNGPRETLDNLMLARFAAFAFLFAFALPISFVPLQMSELYTPLWGLPRNVVLGLPISLEMLCALLSSLAAGTLADKKDWRSPFVAGVLFTALGLIFCALASTGVQFILARGICGLGYGLSWMALQSFLFSCSTPGTRAQGSSHFVAGIFSGHICGTALGAILAERLGYSPVFVTGFFMAFLSLLFFFVFMRKITGTSEVKAAVPTIEPGAVTRYFMDRNASALMFFCVIPFSICQVGLLFFATPLYLNQLGVSQSDIGRVLMIYGLSVVFLAPQLSKIVDSRERKKPFIVMGGLLGGLGLALLFFHQGFAAIVGAIFLLGLASSIGSSAQTAFALKLKATNELGQGKAMAIQRAADKMGQMIGPLALGALMAGVSIANGLVLLGLGYMILSLLFLFLARERMHDPAQTSSSTKVR
jgi:predicted MFS family arabinose efflux permease